MYVCVGGAGKTDGVVSYTLTGGYNGGGYGDQGGGGATHIAKSNNRGVLAGYVNNKSEVLIVAGGGGGSDGAKSKGYGGGINGADTEDHITSGGVHYPSGEGGTQTAGGEGVQNGSFGQGGSLVGRDKLDSAGAGGGGWYGGGSSISPTIGDGGGGSGYIGNSLLTQKQMVIYSGTTSTAESTKTIQNAKVSSTATSDYAKSGDGYCIITWMPVL